MSPPAAPDFHDLAAERAVLGAVLLDNSTYALAASILASGDDFHEASHPVIWTAMGALVAAGSVVDIITLGGELRRMERFNTIGGAQYLAELYEHLPTAAHVEAHARIVAQYANARRQFAGLVDAARELRSHMHDPATAVVKARKRLAAVKPAPKPATKTPPPPESSPEWAHGLSRSKGRTLNTFGNLCKILRDAPEFVGRFKLNTMSQAVEFNGVPLPEDRVGLIREQIEDNTEWGGFSPGEASLMQAIRTVAGERRYHPVRDYLAGLTWDGIERIGRVASEILGATSALECDQVARWFVAAARRALTPGVKVDTALTLIGGQGLFKSTFFDVLGGAWFGDTEITLGDKDTYGQIHWAWIYELGEIDHVTSTRHAGQIKQFMSRKSDLFRPPYGRVTENYPRSCVIVGSANETELLNDPTGSRRFWIVRVGASINIDLLRSWRDQLWAEAVVYANDPTVRHWFDVGEDAAREIAVERHRIRDTWEEVVSTWIADTWPSIQASTRKDYFTTADVLMRALSLTPRDMSKATEMRVGRVLGTLGYVTRQYRVKRTEEGLYRDATGATVRKVRVWITAEEAAATPEDDP